MPHILAERLIAYIDAMETATTWRPIETAPKDGTRVLVLAEDGGKLDVYIAWHDEDGLCDYAGPIDATHWMPLPSTEVR